MIPQKPQQPMPQQQPAAPAAATPMPGQQGPAAAGQGQEVDYRGFIKEVYDLLLARLQAAGAENPNFGQAIDSISPEAAQELFQLLPEAKALVEALGAGDGNNQQQSIGAKPQLQQPGQGNENPLLRDSPVSKGLMG